MILPHNITLPSISNKSGASWTPLDLPGHIETWLGSALGADEEAIPSWPGLTLTHAFAQSVAGEHPTVGIDGGKKFALFDGVDNWLTVDPYTQGTASWYSVFLAVRLLAHGTGPVFFGDGAGLRELRGSFAASHLQVTANTGGVAITADDPLILDTDHIVGVTVNYTTDAVKLYVDGVEVKAGTDNTDSAGFPFTKLVMGGRNGSSGLANVRIYGATLCEAVLTAPEVADLSIYLLSLTPP